MGKSQINCIIATCDNILGPRATKPKPCPQCLQSFNYWLKKKDPQAIVDRQKALRKWQDRMLHLGTKDTRGKQYHSAMKIIPKGASHA